MLKMETSALQGASVDPCSPGMLKCLMKIPDSLWSREAGRLGADERVDLWRYYLQLGGNELCAYYCYSPILKNSGRNGCALIPKKASQKFR